MRQAIVMEAERSGYAIEQIADEAMTVGQMIAFLEQFDEDALFVLSHDRGYTYGSVSERDCAVYEENEDGEFEEGAW